MPEKQHIDADYDADHGDHVQPGNRLSPHGFVLLRGRRGQQQGRYAVRHYDGLSADSCSQVALSSAYSTSPNSSPSIGKGQGWRKVRTSRRPDFSITRREAVLTAM